MSRRRCLPDISVNSFLLVHDNELDFVSFRYSHRPRLYAVWATLCSVYTIAMCVYSGVQSEYGPKIFIWLTYWVFYCLTLRFIVTAVNCWRYSDVTSQRGTAPPADEGTVTSTTGHQLPPEVMVASPRHQLPSGLVLQWLLQNISNNVTVIVTVLFWALIYSGKRITYISINSHGMASALVLIDVMLSSSPVRFLHVHNPVSFCFIYIFFTVVYWAGGGTNHKGAPYIYDILDYSHHPKRAVVVVVCVAFIVVPLMQALICGWCALRERLFHKIKEWRRRENPQKNYQRQFGEVHLPTIIKK